MAGPTSQSVHTEAVAALPYHNARNREARKEAGCRVNVGISRCCRVSVGIGRCCRVSVGIGRWVAAPCRCWNNKGMISYWVELEDK